MPCFNEALTIKEILNRVDNVKLINGIKKEIILVDDFSNDGTREIIKEEIFKENYNSFDGIKKIFMPYNQGKGSAIIKAIDECTGDYTIIQDADLEYSPEDYNLLLRPVIESSADVVYGSRFKGGYTRALCYWHSMGNRFLTAASNMFSNLYLTDMETCYKLIKTNILKNINLKSKRFGFEPEITAKLSKVKNIVIYEVPVGYQGRTYDDGKKINWKDGVSSIYCILKYNLRPGKVFKRPQYDFFKNIKGLKYYDNIIAKICKYIGNEVLELGCGDGLLARKLFKFKRNITCVDNDTELLEKLKEKYNYVENLKVLNMDANNIGNEFGPNTFDTVIAFNLIEHIGDDKSLVKKINSILKKNGCFIGLVPAYNFLFNKLDRSVGQYRRYNTEKLTDLLQEFTDVQIYYYNSMGILGWMVAGGLLKRDYISKNNVKIHNTLFKISNIINNFIFNKLGLNILFIAKK